jgi:hypothetical protein
MELAYMVLYLAWIVGVLAVLFGFPVWLVLAFVAYRTSQRSRRAAVAVAGGEGARVPSVTPFGRPAMVVAVVYAGISAAAALAFAMNTGIPMSGKLSIALRGISNALFAYAPGLLAVLATLSVISIVDMYRRLRVAGVETAVAYGVTITIAAVLLVLTVTGVLHGETR